MLEHKFPFDTVQMPLNCFDASFRSFETQVLPEVTRRGMAALGMKSLGGSGEMVRHGTITAHEGLRYAMSLPVSTTISGIDTIGGSRPKSAGRGKLSAAKRGRDAGLARP